MTWAEVNEMFRVKYGHDLKAEQCVECRTAYFGFWLVDGLCPQCNMQPKDDS